MRNVSLFAEDFAHETFLTRLLEARLGPRHGVAIRVRPVSVTGGQGRVYAELKQYVRQIQRLREGVPDLIVVAVDANCLGQTTRRKQIAAITAPLASPVVHAIPDPHIERWLLLDSKAFKKVLGSGCSAPGKKCEKDRYKRLLAAAIREAGIEPLLGGLEWTEALVDAIDLEHVTDRAFKRLLQDFSTQFRQWGSHD